MNARDIDQISDKMALAFLNHPKYQELLALAHKYAEAEKTIERMKRENDDMRTFIRRCIGNALNMLEGK